MRYDLGTLYSYTGMHTVPAPACSTDMHVSPAAQALVGAAVILGAVLVVALDAAGASDGRGAGSAADEMAMK